MSTGRPVSSGGLQASPPPAHSYTVSARSRAGGLAEATAGNLTIPLDASWGGPPSGRPGPAELLAIAFAACLLKNVERTSQRLGIRYQAATLGVTAARQDAPPRFTAISYELRLTTDEREQRLDLLHRNLRKYGTVYNTLAAGCQIEGRVVRIPPEG